VILFEADGSAKLVTLALVVARRTHELNPSFRYILKPVSFVELSVHFRLTVDADTDVAFRLVGAGGVPDMPVFMDAQLE
jgi:hypothetical protein